MRSASVPHVRPTVGYTPITNRYNLMTFVRRHSRAIIHARQVCVNIKSIGCCHCLRRIDMMMMMMERKSLQLPNYREMKGKRPADRVPPPLRVLNAFKADDRLLLPEGARKVSLLDILLRWKDSLSVETGQVRDPPFAPSGRTFRSRNACA